MAAQNFALTCPLCRGLTAVPKEGSAMGFECSVCRAVFHLDKARAKLAADLIGRRAVRVREDGRHCDSCGSVVFTGETEAVAE
jgi:CRISPR/Cas system-associated protein Cas10 (large subunit of type III CRISPR-Cas system)